MTEDEWDAVVRVHLKGHARPRVTPSRIGRTARRTAIRCARSSTQALCPDSSATSDKPTTAPRRSPSSGCRRSSRSRTRVTVCGRTRSLRVTLARLTADLGGAQPDAEVLTEGPADVDDWSPSSPRWIAPLVCCTRPRPPRTSPAACSRRQPRWSPSPRAGCAARRPIPIDDPTELGDVVAKLLGRRPAERGHGRQARVLAADAAAGEVRGTACR